jgi:hypothetical protein
MTSGPEVVPSRVHRASNSLRTLRQHN